MNRLILSETQSMAVVALATGGRAAYSLESAAQIAGVHPEMARFYWNQGLFGPRPPAAGSEPVFDDDALYELRRIEHYRKHLGVSRRALPLLSRLLREVTRLEAEVRFLND
jgi:DNA-binding transcriptional MerR regulator